MGHFYMNIYYENSAFVFTHKLKCFCPQVKENNYRGHGDSVDQLCWHPTNPDLFVTASGDKTIRIWDVRTTKCIATVNTKGGTLVDVVAGV